jgi:predicted RNase H-like nuclease (RuvC/YqgF family)
MANDLEKDCIKFTEKLLKGYRELKLHLEELKKLKETLKCDYTTQAITYDREKVSPTNKISKEVEEEVIRTLSKIEELENEIEEESSLITKINRSINNLSPIHREIIEYKYIEDLSWDQIIDKTRNTTYSERSLKYKRSEAVKSIAITLFGSKVFKEEESNLFDLINV